MAKQAAGPIRPEEIAELFGGRKVLRQPVSKSLDAHDLIVHGLPGQAVNHLIGRLIVLDAKTPSFSQAMGMSQRTLQRYKASPTRTLSEEQGGKIWKFAEILAHATRVFGSQEDAETWLSQPAIGLEQRKPIDLLATPAGAELVEQFLTRIEYGVYA